MKTNKLSDNWLFQEHSRQTIKRWLSELNYFSFTRAWDLYANKGDAFKVDFTYTNKQDLIDKFDHLGLRLNIIPVIFPKPLTDETFPENKLKKISIGINRFKYFEQPGHTIIYGHKVFIWVSDNSISISVSGTKDGVFSRVSEEDFEACLELEKKLEDLNWTKSIEKNPEQLIYCISAKNYPELYN